MCRKVLLVAVIATSLAGVGNGQETPAGSPPPAATGQVYQTPVYVPAPSPIVGGYYTGYYGGYYGLTTPSATFTSPPPTPGISLADRAGISYSTPGTSALQSTLAPSTMVYTNVQPVSPPVPEVAAVPVAPAPAPGPAAMGPSYFAGSGGVGPVPPPPATPSLGEVAAIYKARRLQNIHTYTNAEVEQLNSRMKMGGIDVNARLGVPPSAAPSGQAPAAPTETAQAEQPPQPARPSAGTATQPTTPQTAQPQPGGQAPAKELPATATLLPLLGILGLAGSGIALIFRRHK